MNWLLVLLILAAGGGAYYEFNLQQQNQTAYEQKLQSLKAQVEKLSAEQQNLLATLREQIPAGGAPPVTPPATNAPSPGSP